MKQIKSTITILIIIVPITVLFFGCGNNNRERLANQLDSLNKVTGERDSMINDFLVSFNEIENSLDSITQRQNIIMDDVKSRTELKNTTRERINDNISEINKLMEKNRKWIESLTKNLRNTSSKYLELEKTLILMRDQLSRKDAELTSMNERLSLMSDSIIVLRTSVDTLTRVGLAQAQTISDQTKAIHTAYYIVGEKNELQDKKIIDSQGGILGMGKIQKIAGNVNDKNFTKIDYSVTTIIPISSKRPKLLTSHPNDSYVMDKNGEGIITDLRITYPEKFWSVSKYMVVIK